LGKSGVNFQKFDEKYRSVGSRKEEIDAAVTCRCVYTLEVDSVFADEVDVLCNQEFGKLLLFLPPVHDATCRMLLLFMLPEAVQGVARVGATWGWTLEFPEIRMP
jgi:hypothetical protein